VGAVGAEAGGGGRGSDGGSALGEITINEERESVEEGIEAGKTSSGGTFSPSVRASFASFLRRLSCSCAEVSMGERGTAEWCLDAVVDFVL